MNPDESAPDWPDEVEEGETVDRKAATRIKAGERLAAKPVSDHDEDHRYVLHMMTLILLFQNEMCVMGVSDGYTDHTINFQRLYAEDRHYVIVYWDPWPLERGSFLQQGKNVAGVCARLYDAEQRLWAITDDELFRVLVNVTCLPKQDGR